MTKTPAERARDYRRRHGIEPRALSDDPVARAKRRIRRGAKMADLDPIEADALRRYQANRARARRDSGATTSDAMILLALALALLAIIVGATGTAEPTPPTTTTVAP